MMYDGGGDSLFLRTAHARQYSVRCSTSSPNDATQRDMRLRHEPAGQLGAALCLRKAIIRHLQAASRG